MNIYDYSGSEDPKLSSRGKGLCGGAASERENVPAVFLLVNFFKGLALLPKKLG